MTTLAKATLEDFREIQTRLLRQGDEFYTHIGGVKHLGEYALNRAFGVRWYQFACGLASPAFPRSIVTEQGFAWKFQDLVVWLLDFRDEYLEPRAKAAEAAKEAARLASEQARITRHAERAEQARQRTADREAQRLAAIAARADVINAAKLQRATEYEATVAKATASKLTLRRIDTAAKLYTVNAELESRRQSGLACKALISRQAKLTGELASLDAQLAHLTTQQETSTP